MRPLDYPLLILVVSFGVFWTSALLGSSLRKRKPALGEDYNQEFMFVLGGTFTLLGLIIGFTFSMAVNRYDQRKNYEEQEANAIGTEYVRSDLLPPEDATKVHALLKSYLDQRIAEYRTRGAGRLQELGARTAKLQAELWSAVAGPASTKPTPINAVLVLGMNDVLNSQSYAQAAWWNRIPSAAWALVTLISIFCNLLIGYGAHGKKAFLFLILPIALAISLFLIADIDSPRGGLIRVHPQNLESLAASLPSQ
jgi:hypothetical protein